MSQCFAVTFHHGNQNGLDLFHVVGVTPILKRSLESKKGNSNYDKCEQNSPIDFLTESKAHSVAISRFNRFDIDNRSFLELENNSGFDGVAVLVHGNIPGNGLVIGG